MSSDEADIANVEGQLQNVLEILLELGICTSEVHPTAVETAQTRQPLANGTASNTEDSDATAGGLVGSKIRQTVDGMATLFRSHEDFPATRNLLIPHEVIDYVDQGRNPELYTRELVERVAGENMYSNGILEAVSSYRDVLMTEMKTAFPDLSEAINALQGSHITTTKTES